MWKANQLSIRLTAGDFGIQLPIEIKGITMAAGDQVKFILKQTISSETILEKTFSNIENNTVNLELTEAESELIPQGSYTYGLDWYQNGVFMCNIIPAALFEVVGKA